MEMHVEDLLRGGGAVGKEEIDAFAPQATCTKGGSRSLRDRPHMPASGFIEFRQIGRMALGDDHGVALSDRADRHEPEDGGVLVEGADWTTSSDNLAEDAFWHGP
jgi:hypothetical protein